MFSSWEFSLVLSTVTVKILLLSETRLLLDSIVIFSLGFSTLATSNVELSSAFTAETANKEIINNAIIIILLFNIIFPPFKVLIKYISIRYY